MIDSSGRGKCNITLLNTWIELKEALSNKIIKYDDIDQALKYTFLKQFDDMLLNNKKLSGLEKFFNEIHAGSELLRSVNLRNKSSNGVSYDRFIPDQKEYPSNNRFSPEGKDFLYLGIGIEENNELNKYSKNEMTCLKEIRAKKGDNIAFCNFRINSDFYDKKIIDLTIADKISYDILEKELLKNMYSTREDKQLKCISDFFTKSYLKILSEEILKPVETEDKSITYAPFHCLANYFNVKGYDGIIYKSTVYEDGKNIVLFDKNYAAPVGEIKYTLY